MFKRTTNIGEAKLPRAMRAEQAEDSPSNTSANPTMGELIDQRLGRRDVLRGGLAVAAIAAAAPLAALSTIESKAQDATKSSFDFKELAAGADSTHHVAEGYDADILIRWGDAVTKDAPTFDPANQSAAAQEKQFGYNNDFLGFFPIAGAAKPGEHGLLVANLEYTSEELMFPGITGPQPKKGHAKITRELAAIEMAAHGGAVIEVRKSGGKWQVVKDSRYGRRITANTPIEVSGPAAGHDRMKTNADPSGRKVLGMINNCAGGVTPWGTWLTCEENFNNYFTGRRSLHPDAAKLKRYGAPGNRYNWGNYDTRFNVNEEPNEIHRFGWVVEIDPFDPASTPKKRTAMGRFKHEGAAGIVNKDGRYVIYQGDDQRFDYVYKFVTDARVNTANKAANRDILDQGTLYVAKYNADGSGEWMPLVFGQDPLTVENGFNSQADVLIDARLAADKLGATKMDRPEDVEANPKSGKVYVMLTNNTRRKPGQEDKANPRAANRFGHIIEMIPDKGDHTATTFRWEILVKCGDHTVASTGASFNKATTANGWFGMPDNVAFDPSGRMWIATDGNSNRRTGRNDGIWAIETEGPMRGTSRHFFRVPTGAEMCGPCFTPDGETLFVAVQHPAEGKGSSFETPATRWPDFNDAMPPRPSIVAITKKGGGKIG
ncbi:MAG: PhoX family phosphatase [Hyphomicrobiales bacterium]|nr:PhoX family phosphatase [Hyphomicrobiales bacterium]